MKKNSLIGDPRQITEEQQALYNRLNSLSSIQIMTAEKFLGEKKLISKIDILIGVEPGRLGQDLELAEEYLSWIELHFG